MHLFSYGFRPFFLCTGIYAVVAMLVWLTFFMLGGYFSLPWNPAFWHVHEFLYGLVPAAIAGFLLTAVPNWTSSPPLNGRWLFALVVVWVLGRLSFCLIMFLPIEFVALIDGAFLPILAFYLVRVLCRYRSYRNTIVGLVLVLLSAGNTLMLLGFVYNQMSWIDLGQRLGLGLMALLMIVIAGRITPLFSINYLKKNGGEPNSVIRSKFLDYLSIASAAVTLCIDMWVGHSELLGSVVLITGVLNGLRLILWRGYGLWREPLLLILHIGYAWIVLAFILRGGEILWGPIGHSLWQHAMGAGAVATLLLGVMTRVSAGHTGRTLALEPFAIGIYISIVLSGLFRLCAALLLIDYMWGISLSALFWVLAFLQFCIQYTSILLGPRVNTRP